jgi:hypothetical protein
MTTVIFICPKCGVLYRTEQESFTRESAGRFDCIDCNAEIFAWRGLYDFVRWKAITIGGFDEIQR